MFSQADMSPVFFSSTKWQKYAGKLAIGTAVIATIMTIKWATEIDVADKYLGGLNWNKRVFSWHPIMMVTGMVLCLVTSLLTYRIIQLPKVLTKSLHVLMHTTALVCTAIGLSAVFTSHNDPAHNMKGTITANLYSLHSLLGISAVVLYASNYVLGFYFFLTSFATLQMKIVFKPNHVFLGVFTLFAAGMAVQTGLAELTTKLGCIYTVTTPDLNPAEHYSLLPGGCQLANGIGIMVLLTFFLTAYALLGPGVENRVNFSSAPKRKTSSSHGNSSSSTQQQLASIPEHSDFDLEDGDQEHERDHVEHTPLLTSTAWSKQQQGDVEMTSAGSISSGGNKR